MSRRGLHAILLVLAIALAALPVSAAQESARLVLGPAAAGQVPVRLMGVDDFGTATIEVTYDPEVVDVARVKAGDVAGTTTSRVDGGSARVVVVTSQVPGPSGDLLLAVLDTDLRTNLSALDLMVEELADSSGNAIPHVVEKDTAASSGGGGAAAATAEAAPSEGAQESFRTEPATIAAEGTLAVSFPPSDEVEGIQVDFAQERSDVVLELHRLEDLESADTSDPGLGDSALRFFRVELSHSGGKVAPEDVQAARITLRVEVAGAAAQQVFVLRHDALTDTWAPQPTRVLEASDSNVRIEATLPGFSVLAVAVDRDPPTLTFLDGLLADKALAPSDPLQVEVKDNRGVKEFQMFLDGEEVEVEYDGTTATHVPSKPLAPGAHTLQLRALDESGHEATATHVFQVAAANVKPEIPQDVPLHEADPQLVGAVPEATGPSPGTGLVLMLVALMAVVWHGQRTGLAEALRRARAWLRRAR